jgi:hypothetical protein
MTAMHVYALKTYFLTASCTYLKQCFWHIHNCSKLPKTNTYNSEWMMLRIEDSLDIQGSFIETAQWASAQGSLILGAPTARESVPGAKNFPKLLPNMSRIYL